jgi:DNA-binding SARP family transcriptional activator
MEFRLLGVMEVRDASGPIELPSGRGRALLAILALHAGQPVAAERLIDELWTGTPPATAATVVHGLVSKLRRALSSDGADGTRIIETVGKGYRLAVDPDSVDAIRFERLVAAAPGAATVRSEVLAQALALWRGSALVDFTYDPFAQRTIRALEESRIQASEDLLDAELELDRTAEVIPRARELIEAHPFRERLHGVLMTALYRAGRQAEALAAYAAARALLREELGVEPGPALQSLEAAILRQDSSLETTKGERDTPPPSEAPAWLPRERRRVSVAVVAFAPAADANTDPETLARVGAKAAQVSAEVLRSHGARVERSLGDELIAFFGFPHSHEDDALRAVRAVLDVRLRVQSQDLGDGVRPGTQAGIETGDIVIAGPGGALPDVVTGPVISAARRLALAAPDGDVLLGPGTLRLVRGSAIVTPVEDTGGWLVLELAPSVATAPRAPEAPMIGREHEISQLRAAVRRAVRSGSPVRATVVGDAGIGKSRLAREVVSSLGAGVQAITIRCGPPDDALGFHPVRQALVEAAGVLGWRGLHTLLETAADGASAVDEVASAVALRCPPATADQLAPPMAHLLEGLARRKPLVVVLDDLHWADRAFLDLVEGLEKMTGSVLLLGLTRPDDGAPPNTTPDVLQLEPLADSDVAELVIGQGGPVTPSSLHRIVGLAQGNPLYAEQLLAAVDGDELDAIPASLVGLLSMRLDRLGPGERDVLRCAAVGGLDVDLEAVRDLLPPEAVPFIATHLDALVRRQLLVRGPGARLRFAHVLLQMAAYRSLTTQDRQRLQAAFEARAARPSDPAAGLDRER